MSSRPASTRARSLAIDRMRCAYARRWEATGAFAIEVTRSPRVGLARPTARTLEATVRWSTGSPRDESEQIASKAFRCAWT